MRVYGWIVMMLAGCLNSATVECQDGRTCPAGTLCDETNGLCVTQPQLDACLGLEDGAMCTKPSPGSCHGGVCLDAACGNGRVDFGEACDDGDLIDSNSCSADCVSDNTCGNGVQDLALEETCDDGNHLDHDGCSSTCEAESPHWVNRPVTPGERRAVGAYDPRRGRLVVFGGGGTYIDTWEWDAGWIERRTTAHPPPAYDSAGAYDAARERFVLFGGSGNGDYPQTWEWDGALWRRGSDGPPRSRHAMAYDAKRDRMVVFGGSRYANNVISSLDDTLVRVSETWQMTTIKGPSARESMAMAYDPRRDRIVMYGGATRTQWSGAVQGDLWELDGDTWSAIAQPTLRPPPLVRATMVFDPKRQAVVLFGGFTEGDPVMPSDQTWTWDGTTWTQLPATTKPSARGGAVLAAVGDRLLMFGGTTTPDGASKLDDTWLYENGTWKLEPAPSMRGNYGVTTDFVRGRVVMFGGQLNSGGSYPATGETWELAADGWHLYTGSTPSPRSSPILAYDPDRRVTLLFGQQATTNDTWTWDGLAWTQRFPPTSPPAVAQADLAHDAVNKTMLLFGGVKDDATFSGETWSWNGTTWTKVAITGPSPRSQPTMATDLITGHVLLFGGNIGGLDGFLVDTWSWDGTAWTELHPVISPPPSEGPALTWNVARSRLTLITNVFDVWEWNASAVTWEQVFATTAPASGYGAGAFASRTGSGISLGVTFFGTTGADLRWDGTRGVESCLGSDLDRDAAARCDDQDCWFVCTPTCPPSTSCDPLAPHCGDGACSGAESCATCPGDCACASVCGDFICDPAETCPGDC